MNDLEYNPNDYNELKKIVQEAKSSTRSSGGSSQKKQDDGYTTDDYAELKSIVDAAQGNVTSNKEVEEKRTPASYTIGGYPYPGSAPTQKKSETDDKKKSEEAPDMEELRAIADPKYKPKKPTEKAEDESLKNKPALEEKSKGYLEGISGFKAMSGSGPAYMPAPFISKKQADVALPAINEAKEATLKAIQGAADAFIIGEDAKKNEVEYDSAKALNALKPDQVTPDIRERYHNVADPDELEQWPKWYPKTEEQHRILFNKDKTNATVFGVLKDVWNFVPKTAAGGASFLTDAAAGFAKAGAMVAPPPVDAGQEEWDKYRDNLLQVANVYGVKIGETYESLENHAASAAAYGLSWADSARELLHRNGLPGGITHEEAFENYLGRQRAKEHWESLKSSSPNVYTRLLFGDPDSVRGSLATGFVRALVSSTSPSVESRLARFKGDREAAIAEKKRDDDNATKRIIDDIRKNAVVVDPDLLAATDLTPGAFNEFVVGGTALRLSSKALAKGVRAAKTFGKTAEEIRAMDSAAAKTAFQKDLYALEKAQKPGVTEKTLGAIASGVDIAKEFGSRALEGIPDFAKSGGSVLGGGLIGMTLEDEHPMKGFFYGSGVGLGGYLSGKGVGKALSVAGKLPATGQAFLEGMRGAAGEGAFVSGVKKAVTKAEELGLDAKVARRLADKGIPAAKAADWLAENAHELAIGNIKTIPMAIALGIYNNNDIDEIADLAGQGMLFHTGAHVRGNLFGVTPDRVESEFRKRRAISAKFYNSLDAENQAHLNELTDWEMYVKGVRTKTQEAAVKNEQAKAEHADAVVSGDESKIQKAEEKMQKAENELHHRVAQLGEAESAGPEDIRFYGDHVRFAIADMMNTVNGSTSPGRNLNLHFKNADQIKNDILKKNENVPLTDFEKLELKNVAESAAKQRGMFLSRGGKYTLSTGKEVDLSDSDKSKLVINMDLVRDKVWRNGEAALGTIRHEIGHALWESKEYREQNADIINKLFGTQKFDERGQLIAGEAGLLSQEELVKRFKENYANRADGGWQKMAQDLGLFDPVTNDVDPKNTAEYMKPEIMAELISGGIRQGIRGEPKAWLAPLVDWLTIKNKNSAASKAMREYVGLHGTTPWESKLVGEHFTADMLEKTKQAVRSVADMNGDLTAAETIPYRKISETEIRSNEAVADQFKDLLFATEKVATVVDSEGNAIASIPLSNQNTFEGTWIHHENERGESTLSQTSGYGPGTVPAEVGEKLGGTQVPVGGKIIISSRIKRDSSGSLQMLTPAEQKALTRERGKMIRQAIESATDVEYPGRMTAETDEKLGYGGILSPKQIENIKALPETILPHAMKRRIIQFNQLLVNNNGESMIALYGQAMDRNGRYRSFPPKIVDFVPLGLRLSKDGNFLFTIFSKTGMREKLRRWEMDHPERLQLWNGNSDEFMADLKKVTENWKPTDEFPQGRPGETGLDADPATAIAKKNRINDFLNIYAKTDEASNLANPIRSKLKKPARRLTAEERKDEQSSDPNTLVRTYRADRVHELAATQDEPLRVNYGKAKYNLMPESEAGEAPEFIRPPSSAVERGLRGVRGGGVQFMPQKEGDVDKINESERISNYERILDPRQRRERDIGEAGGGQGTQESRSTGPVRSGARVLEDAVRRADSEAKEVQGKPQSRQTSEPVKRAQDAALVEAASQQGMLLDPSDFLRRWKESGGERGAEHLVILDSGDGLVEKRTDATHFHNTWSDYFDRIRLHNLFFPETAISIEGVHNQNTDPSREYVEFSKNINNKDFIDVLAAQNGSQDYSDLLRSGAYVVTKQPYIKISEAPLSQDQISEFLAERNFHKIPSYRHLEYYNPEAKVFLQDAHSGNVVLGTDPTGVERIHLIDAPFRRATKEDAETINAFNKTMRGKFFNGKITLEKYVELEPFLTEFKESPEGSGTFKGIQFMPEKPGDESEGMQVPKSRINTEERLRGIDSLGDKNSTQVDADTRPYKVNPDPESVTLPPRWGLVNKNIVGMPKSFKQVNDLIDRLVARLQYVVKKDPAFARESAQFYLDMAESALKMTDIARPDISGLDRWLGADLNLRFLALGSPKSTVKANSTKAASSLAGYASNFPAGLKIGMTEQGMGAKKTYEAWQKGEHFDLSLPGVQDKVRSFYINGLSELIELAAKEGDTKAAQELMLRAGKSMRVIDPGQTTLSEPEVANIQRLLDGKATVDMWDMAAKGEAWPGYLINVKDRNKETMPWQWTQDKFEKRSTLKSKQWKQVLKELKVQGPADLPYQQARALKIDGNKDWNEETWEARKQQPFPEDTQFSYYTAASEAGLTPGGGGPLYDAQQAIDGLLADRLNELGYAAQFGKQKLKARNAQEILWALEKLDNPVEKNQDLSLFRGTFDPMVDEVNILRGVPNVNVRGHLGKNALEAMLRAYAEMAKQTMPLEVVSAGTSPEAVKIQQVIAGLKAAGDQDAERTLTNHVASGLHHAINHFADKHGLKVTADVVAVGDGAYTEGVSLNLAPNMRIVLRGDPEDTYHVLESLSRALDQDGGNIIRKPTITELNDASTQLNKVLTFDTRHLSTADRNKFFMDVAQLKDANGNPFLTGFTETQGGTAIGNQFYDGDFEAAITLNKQAIDTIMQKHQVPKMFVEDMKIDTFYRGQSPTKTTSSEFSKDIYDHISRKLASVPTPGDVFPQVVDFETLWRSRVEALREKEKAYPIDTKENVQRAKKEAPQVASQTARTAAHTELKTMLNAAVLRDEISEERAKELGIEYGYINPRDKKTDTSDE